MSNTARLGLPLVQAAQAQKHVTVNEALVRLDGLVNLVLQSESQTIPPTLVVDGACFAVPLGAVNAWGGYDGAIAIGTNGGWDFVQPMRGWRAFIVDRGANAVFDGSDWREGTVTLSANNAGLALRTVETDHAVAVGPVSLTGYVIPSNAMVVGVTGRVISPITGTLTGWSLGNPGAVGRFGSGLGLSGGSWVRGLLSAPMTYYAPEVLQLDATGGDFAGGTVRLAVHFLELGLPDL
ncbi:MAG TPA: DUF2793 domain-containing protein [Albidovulum sp.]|uniref:DUF2793 domain-containing protein n=1 Tax=Albidovulum sp. TaxID=1872424 RepID=UPI002BF9804D|nr:DUF2793 domain-containing protein [Albidovulum sp.]